MSLGMPPALDCNRLHGTSWLAQRVDSKRVLRPDCPYCHRDIIFYDSAKAKQETDMEALKILADPESLTWEYDEDGDVLYISIGDSRPAVTVDIGESVLVRYDEAAGEVVGITVLNVRRRLLAGLA